MKERAAEFYLRGWTMAAIGKELNKTPRSIEFAEELPRSPAGKIQRGKVRDPHTPDIGAFEAAG